MDHKKVLLYRFMTAMNVNKYLCQRKNYKWVIKGKSFYELARTRIYGCAI
jgi:hypothetical protein